MLVNNVGINFWLYEFVVDSKYMSQTGCSLFFSLYQNCNRRAGRTSENGQEKTRRWFFAVLVPEKSAGVWPGNIV